MPSICDHNDIEIDRMNLLSYQLVYFIGNCKNTTKKNNDNGFHLHMKDRKDDSNSIVKIFVWYRWKAFSEIKSGYGTIFALRPK